MYSNTKLVILSILLVMFIIWARAKSTNRSSSTREGLSAGSAAEGAAYQAPFPHSIYHSYYPKSDGRVKTDWNNWFSEGDIPAYTFPLAERIRQGVHPYTSDQSIKDRFYSRWL